MNAEEAQTAYLRIGLVQALRRERLGRVCRQEPSDATHLVAFLGQAVLWSILLALPVWLLVRTDVNPWLVPVAAVVFLALIALVADSDLWGIAALFIIAAWIAACVESYASGGNESFAIVTLAPFALVAVGISMWRALALATTIPFLLPAALVVVFIPLLTQDLWVIGDEIGSQLLFVGIVALGPPAAGTRAPLRANRRPSAVRICPGADEQRGAPAAAAGRDHGGAAPAARRAAPGELDVVPA